MHNGQEAIDLLANCTEYPEIILPGLNMPVMGGVEFLRNFEQIDKYIKHTHVFIITCSIMEQDRMNWLAFELVKGYFEKPLTRQGIDELLHAVSVPAV